MVDDAMWAHLWGDNRHRHGMQSFFGCVVLRSKEKEKLLRKTLFPYQGLAPSVMEEKFHRGVFRSSYSGTMQTPVSVLYPRSNAYLLAP